MEPAPIQDRANKKIALVCGLPGLTGRSVQSSVGEESKPEQETAVVDFALGMTKKQETVFKHPFVLLEQTGGHGDSGQLALLRVATEVERLEKELVMETHVLELTKRLASVILVLVLHSWVMVLVGAPGDSGGLVLVAVGLGINQG